MLVQTATKLQFELDVKKKLSEHASCNKTPPVAASDVTSRGSYRSLWQTNPLKLVNNTIRAPTTAADKAVQH